MDRSFTANTVLAALITTTTYVLWSAGEVRFDAYISLYALEYIVVKVTLRPKKRFGDFIALVLFTLFIIFVVIRVAEVLGIWVIKP